jgi:hypothetical protein
MLSLIKIVFPHKFGTTSGLPLTLKDARRQAEWDKVVSEHLSPNLRLHFKCE